MSRKYTIVIDPELHDWFAHQAIDARRSISALIVDAMDAYRRARIRKKPVHSSAASPPDDPIQDVKIPEVKPKPYVKTIYHPGSNKLNDTPRAREVSKAARKIASLLMKAKSIGVPVQELHKTLKDANIDFQTRREALTYLRANNVAERPRDKWIHADFFKPPKARPPSSD